MTQLAWGLVALAFAALLFVLMWTAWRRRTRRDAATLPEVPEFTGAPTASFARVFYVATTPEDAPLERIAAPGLSFRGYGDIDVFAGGFELRLPGERPVRIPASALAGSGSAQVRIDKVVERDGLTLVRWRSGERVLESSFRFAEPAEQHRFASAIDVISTPNTSHTSESDETTQEA